MKGDKSSTPEVVRRRRYRGEHSTLFVHALAGPLCQQRGVMVANIPRPAPRRPRTRLPSTMVTSNGTTRLFYYYLAMVLYFCSEVQNYKSETKHN